MGCDIHFYVEKKEAGKWVTADKWSNPYSDDHKDVDSKDEFYGNRNYDLFAILANVRNGYGFAGSPTGFGFVPICEPKGFPEDACEEVKELCEHCGEHTPSWLTLKEILDYDWTQRTVKQCSVSAWQYFEWSRWRKGKGEELPEEYCSWSSGDYITEAKMERLVEPYRKLQYAEAEKELKKLDHKQNCYLLIEMPYHKLCQNFWYNTIPRLLRLGNPEDVRAVFWFDS